MLKNGLVIFQNSIQTCNVVKHLIFTWLCMIWSFWNAGLIVFYNFLARTFCTEFKRTPSANPLSVPASDFCNTRRQWRQYTYGWSNIALAVQAVKSYSNWGDKWAAQLVWRVGWDKATDIANLLSMSITGLSRLA